jgi:hypothetical protein
MNPEKREYFSLHKGSFFGWGWKKANLPHPQDRKDIPYIVTILNIKPMKGSDDWSKHRNSDVVFVTGDGGCLPHDCKEFESWDIPHDLFAVNRSLIFHQRQVHHWAAIDLEETIWFTQNLTDVQQPDQFVKRHTIGDIPTAVDFTWDMDYNWEDDAQKLVFIGNSGYFAVLVSIHMGYQKIVLGGMPLNTLPHWYESKSDNMGPNWAGHVYTQWMDFKMQVPGADKVKSMSGYSAFILGQATKEWVNGS